MKNAKNCPPGKKGKHGTVDPIAKSPPSYSEAMAMEQMKKPKKGK